MNFKEYFENIQGIGILATSDLEGKVDLAVYAKPHIMGDNTFAFIMPDRLTHHNLQSNPHAAYLFLESGKNYSGKRFFLVKAKEEKDTELLYSIRRKNYGEDRDGRYLVFFDVKKILPLIGEGEKGGMG